ncbi:MAG TPA: hypothetical protein VD886_16770 [Herpetosiphonaceae bacterium]|nr:hypothetical protein [Herpetosiphonaceae bacterium]
MNIDTTPLVKALLWAGIEDYCPLWQAVWEVNTLAPDASEQERLDLTRVIVRSLLDQGAIELVWVEGDAVEPIDLADAQQLINKSRTWAVRHDHERQACLSTTAAGEQRYRELP